MERLCLLATSARIYHCASTFCGMLAEFEINGNIRRAPKRPRVSGDLSLRIERSVSESVSHQAKSTHPLTKVLFLPTRELDLHLVLVVLHTRFNEVASASQVVRATASVPDPSSTEGNHVIENANTRAEADLLP